jgi:hypothetical protein
MAKPTSAQTSLARAAGRGSERAFRRLYDRVGLLLGLCNVVACGATPDASARMSDASPDGKDASPNASDAANGSGDAIYTPAQAVNLCVAFQACFPKEFPNVWSSLNSCASGVDLVSLFFPQPGDFTMPQVIHAAINGPAIDFYNCALAAGTDCTKVAACLALDPAPDTCTNGTGLANGTCTGSLLHGCTADDQPFAVNCARYDSVCKGGAQSCQFEACPSGVKAPCDGAEVIQCTTSGQPVEVVNCTVDGPDFTCTQAATDAGPSEECKGTTPCMPDAGGTCEGSVLVDCENETLAHIDCATYSRRCSDGGCVAMGTDCDPSLPSTCQGATVVFCDNGYVKTADCTPFGTCSMGACVHM